MILTKSMGVWLQKIYVDKDYINFPKCEVFPSPLFPNPRPILQS